MALRVVSRLSVADRFLGVVFGASRGLLLVTLGVMVGSMTMLPQAPWWQSASLLPYFENSASWLANLMPERLVQLAGNDVHQQQVREILAKVKVPGTNQATAQSVASQEHRSTNSHSKTSIF